MNSFLWLLLGIAIGLVVGWNLLPQPERVKRLYNRAVDGFGRWTSRWLILACVLSIGGCTLESKTELSRDQIMQAEADAVVAMAFAGYRSDGGSAPDDDDGNGPNVGDKCPQCNDPPGKCGVGRVGDGNICNPCRICAGDGRMDEGDIARWGMAPTQVSEPDTLPPEVIKTPLPAPEPTPAPPIPPAARETPPIDIKLHVSSTSAKGWALDWWTKEREYFTMIPGVTCSYVKEPQGEAWIEVCVDGKPCIPVKGKHDPRKPELFRSQLETLLKVVQ